MFPFCSIPQRGVSRSSRHAGWNAVDATASGARSVAGWLPLGDSVSGGFRADDTALTASLPGFEGEHTPAVGCPAETCADGEVVWSWRPKAGVKLRGGAHTDRCECRNHPRGDGGNRARLTGESAKQPLKPSRREGRAVPAEPVVHPCAVFCARTAGASRRPAFPAPSFLKEGETIAKLGQNVPRECGGVSCREAKMQELEAMARSSVIASCSRRRRAESRLHRHGRDKPGHDG